MKKSIPPTLGMILKGYPRISETFISNEILRLEELGFRVHIFSMRHPRESFSHESIRRIRAEVDYLPQTILEALPELLFRNLMAALRSPGRYGNAMRIAFRRFLRTRKSATVKHLLQAGYIVHKLLSRRPIAHLHAHFAHSPTSVAMFTSLISGIPFSFTGHAKDIYTSDPRQIREKLALAQFAVTCTEYNRDHLRRVAADGRTPLFRVYHGIDTWLFAGEGAARTPTEPYRILTIARLVPKKGLPTVYRALRLLRDRGVCFEHRLIGDGDDREKVLALIRKLALDDCCHWLGTMPHETVLGHYRWSDLFVLGCEVTANGDRDGIPNVFVEAMAMNVPVVGTDISAIPELIRSGETGLLVRPQEPEALADAVQRMLTDTALRQRVIPAARRFVLERFDNRKLIRDLAHIFREHAPVLSDGR